VPQILATQPTNVVVVEVDSTALFIWSVAHGIKSQSVLQLVSVSAVATAATPADVPEMAKAGSELVLVHTA